MATQLVALPAVERLSPAVIRILGSNPGKFTLQGTNTYLVGTGRRRILIDTGEGRPAWAASLRETLDREGATVETALLSHWHHDHVGGVDDLLALAPGAGVYKRDPAGPGQRPIDDGQRFAVDGATLTAAHTPGHTADHTVFVLAEENAMFTADSVLGQGTAVFESLSAYLASLDRMRAMFRGRAYPGHGPVLDDGPAKIAEYIGHRRQREEQVVRTMRGGNPSPPAGEAGQEVWTAMDVVRVVYSDVPQELHQAACGGVLQILDKLEGEDRVSREGSDGWRLRDRSTL